VDEQISPELVLVCPELAERARARLPGPPLDDMRLGEEISTPRLEGLLAELALVVGELKREQEVVVRRLEDLSELVNQISSNWEEVDRRLAGLEQAATRLEAAGAELEVARAEPERPLLVEDARPARHGWPLLTGPLLLVGSLIAIMTVLELLPSFAENPRLGSRSGGGLTSAQEPRSSSTATDREQVAPSAVTGPTVTGTRPSGETQPEPSETPPAPKSPTTTGTPKATVPVAPAATRPGSGTRTGTVTTAGDTSEFEPSRSFLWAPVKGAAFYSVTFLREGKVVYTARVSQPRVVLPPTFRFTPGAYRWIVRTDSGPPSNTLSEPIVASTFSVARR